MHLLLGVIKAFEFEDNLIAEIETIEETVKKLH